MKKESSGLGPIFLIVLVDVMSLSLMIPLLPFYAKAFGATDVTVGFLFATYSAAQLVAGPVLGNLSDRYGRRPLLLSSQLGMIASLLVLAFARELWTLFIARAISGLTAGNLTIAQAYISDRTRPDQRTRAFAVIGIAFGVGFTVGPAISAVLTSVPLIHPTHDQLLAALARPLFLAAAVSALSFTTTYLLLREDTKPGASTDAGPAGRRLGILEWSGYLEYLRRPHLRSLLFQFFLFSVAFSFFFSGLALFADHRFGWGPHEVGYMYAYAGVLAILIQGGALRQLSKRYGDSPLVIAGFAAYFAGYLLLGLAVTVGLLIVAATVLAFGQSFVRPALTARVTQASSRTEQGITLGLLMSLQALAQVFSPPLGTLLIQHRLLFVWALVSSVLSAIALALAILARRDPPGIGSEAP